jgi:hypothetical protein
VIGDAGHVAFEATRDARARLRGVKEVNATVEPRMTTLENHHEGQVSSHLRSRRHRTDDVRCQGFRRGGRQFFAVLPAPTESDTLNPAGLTDEEDAAGVLHFSDAADAKVGRGFVSFECAPT